MISPQKYVQRLKTEMEAIADWEYAEAQANYLRNKFELFGIKAKPRQEIIKRLMKEVGVYHGDELTHYLEACYGEPYRDLHYAAVHMVEKVIKEQSEDFIDTLEWLIVENSWWDTVDSLAKQVGIHFNKYPNQIKPYTEKWITGDNMWLQRVAIIFQLFYKKNTDTALLFDYIRRKKDSQEFFIQKAMGWALRQHTRTDAQAVIDFVEQEGNLPRLTVKEALRLIKD